jgi:hypothetical protein
MRSLMGIRLLTGQISPIVVDFGHASVKVLQVNEGATPELVAAAEVPVPEGIRDDVEARDAFVAERLPAILRTRGFKGRRVVVAPHAISTFIEHLQVPASEGLDPAEQVRLQMQSRLARSGELVIRSWQVGEVHRDEGLRHEHIGVAIERREVMKLVEMFRRARLSVVGVHDGLGAMVRSFGHLHRRESDQSRRTVYIDLGHGHTSIAITEGTRIVFAKSIPTGGRDLGVGEFEASIPAPAPNPVAAPAAAGGVGFGVSIAEDRRGDGAPQELSRRIPETVPVISGGEALDHLRHEVAMCLRYHASIAPNAPAERVIFVGGEARRTEVCQALARTLRLPAQLGDPLARLGGLDRAGLSAGPHPGWAVAYGLCASPTDL